MGGLAAMYARLKSRLKNRISRFLDHIVYEAARKAIDNALKGDAPNVHKAIIDALEVALELDAANLRRQLKRQALGSSASYVIENLPLECRFGHRDQLLEHSAKEAPANGLVLEFGVYHGQSISHLAACMPDRTIFGFDSFEGLPEAWNGFPPGLFNINGQVPSVPENVILIKGWFNQTLPSFLSRNPGPIALLHIDSDLYSSCRCVLEALSDRVEEGTIIVFDELINYPGWERGEYQALQEWLGATRAALESIGFVESRSPDWQRDGSTGEQVAFRVTRPPESWQGVANESRRIA
jgi:predicted O-methyltransferase YrrM